MLLWCRGAAGRVVALRPKRALEVLEFNEASISLNNNVIAYEPIKRSNIILYSCLIAVITPETDKLFFSPWQYSYYFFDNCHTITF